MNRRLQQYQDDIRARLKAAGERYKAAKDATAAYRAELDPLIPEALKAGIPPGEVETLSTLSHETIRTARKAAGLPPAPRGGAR